MNKQFNTVAGSYITEDEDIYLVVEEHKLEEAVRDLYRIGLDNVIGYVTPMDLDHYAEQGGELEAITVQKFDNIDQYIGDDNYQILDVRKASEYSEGNIEGAQNLAHTRLLPRLDEISKDKTLVIHCQAGGRSAVASGFLKRKGYKVVLIDDEFENYKPKAATTV
jgi:hydroxyacylglutathione hydrolase